MVDFSHSTALARKSGEYLGSSWRKGLDRLFKIQLDHSVRDTVPNFHGLRRACAYSFWCHLPALQGVEFAHQFDQRIGGWFGHQGRDGASAWGLWSVTVPFSSIWARRVLQRPSLKTLERERRWKRVLLCYNRAAPKGLQPISPFLLLGKVLKICLMVSPLPLFNFGITEAWRIFTQTFNLAIFNWAWMIFFIKKNRTFLPYSQTY